MLRIFRKSNMENITEVVKTRQLKRDLKFQLNFRYFFPKVFFEKHEEKQTFLSNFKALSCVAAWEFFGNFPSNIYKALSAYVCYCETTRC